MTDEWQGWLHEFPSREAVEAHVAASPPPPYASAWATGAPWMRVGGCGDLVVIYLAVIDGEVRERFGGDAAWHAMEMGRAGMWRPITALGEETGVRAAGPIIEALDAAAVRLARENAALRLGVDALTAERDAAFNRGVDAMREAAVQHFKQRAEGIEHAAARIACIAPTAAVCATLDEARRVADVADEIRALEVAP